MTTEQNPKEGADAELLRIIRRLADAWRPLLERGFYGQNDLDEARAALAEADRLIAERES